MHPSNSSMWHSNPRELHWQRLNYLGGREGACGLPVRTQDHYLKRDTKFPLSSKCKVKSIQPLCTPKQGVPRFWIRENYYHYWLRPFLITVLVLLTRFAMYRYSYHYYCDAVWRISLLTRDAVASSNPARSTSNLLSMRKVTNSPHWNPFPWKNFGAASGFCSWESSVLCTEQIGYLKMLNSD